MLGGKDDSSITIAALFILLEAPDGIRREERIGGSQLASREGLVIGRAKPAGLILKRGSVSRQHCRLASANTGSIIIEDLGSRNGTFVDGQRLAEGQKVPVTEDSVVEIGDIKIRFRIEGAENSDHNLTTMLEKDVDEGWSFHVRCGGAREERHTVAESELKRAEGVVLGRRNADIDIIVTDPSVSRAHCRVGLDPGNGLYITDLNSRNGTLLNGIRLLPDTVTSFEAGARIELGAARMTVVAPKSVEEPVNKEVDKDKTQIAPVASFDETLIGDRAAGVAPTLANMPFTTLKILLEEPDGNCREERIEGELFVTGNGVVLGSAFPSDLIVNRSSVSRQHCRLDITPSGGVVITDMGSTNGSFVDGRRLDQGRSNPVTEQCVMEIGDIKIRFHFETVHNADLTVVHGTSAPADETVVDQPRALPPLPADVDATVLAPKSLPPATKVAPMAAARRQPVAASSETSPLPSLPLPEPLGSLRGPNSSGSSGGGRSLAVMTAFGGFLIPAAIVVSPFVILMGTPEITAMAARYLVAFVTGLVAVYSVCGVIGELHRRRNTQNIQALEIDRLRREIAFSAERVARQEETVAASWSGFRKFRVARKVSEGGDIFSFYFVPHDQKPHPSFEPGQHITFQLHVPGHPKPIVRCYTLSDSPFETEYYRVSIKRAFPPREKPDAPPGLSSNYFHDHVEEGDIIDIRAPSGKFFLDMTKNSPIVLIGGGIGITPALAMAKAVVASGSRRETWLYYGVTDSDQHIMKEDLVRLARNNENIHLQVCYSDPREDVDIPGTDYHHPERISVDLLNRMLPSNNYEFYICGPPPMMESLVSGLEEWGVPEDTIHFEAFGPATVKRAARVAEVSNGVQTVTASVEFAKSSKVVPWSGDNSNLLEFAEANGMVMKFGCRAGSCGECLCAIKSGKVRYLEDPGIEPDAGSCLTCISIPDGDVVLEA